MGIDIQKMSPNEHREVAQLLALAFEKMPSTLSVYKKLKNVNQKQEVLFEALISQKAGTVYIAKDQNDIVGMMRISQWPDCQMKPFEALKTLPLIVRTLGMRTLPRAMKMRGAWSKNDPKFPHWHLDPIGVHPNHQGKGIGSKLMAYYCDMVDENNDRAYLETDKAENVSFYEKFGYKVIKKEKVLDFTTWYMLRESSQ